MYCKYNNNITYSYSENALHPIAQLNLSQQHCKIGPIIIPIYMWEQMN